MEKDELLRELMQLDFLAVDLSLIINKQRENKEVLCQHERIICLANVIRERL